jgi:hypothetical protein
MYHSIKADQEDVFFLKHRISGIEFSNLCPGCICGFLLLSGNTFNRHLFVVHPALQQISSSVIHDRKNLF